MVTCGELGKPKDWAGMWKGPYVGCKGEERNSVVGTWGCNRGGWNGQNK